MERYNQLINKKLTGEIEPWEEAELLNWVQESSENELLYRRMMDVWNEGQYRVRIRGQQASFNKISRKLDLEESIFGERNASRAAERWTTWYRAAVVFVFLLAAVGIFYLKSVDTGFSKAVEQSNLIVKTSPAGQKTRINLPDGSVCWLNSESEIRFLSNFTDSTRDIYLTGEAYFEVAKDPFKPFKVYAPDMMITALGTVFNISSFPEDQRETVVLVEGSISVVCADSFYSEVWPGEAVCYDKRSKRSDKIFTDPDEAIAWKEGVLIFDDETYETIFAKLKRWYGVNITVTGDLPEKLKYRASFKNELLVNILESIRYGHDFNYMIDGKNIKIMFNNKRENL